MWIRMMDKRAEHTEEVRVKKKYRKRSFSAFEGIRYPDPLGAFSFASFRVCLCDGFPSLKT